MLERFLNSYFKATLFPGNDLACSFQKEVNVEKTWASFWGKGR